ncbi:MAG: insulinase family protein [Deltaproteobacteria bacterium]|nr:insulinase family protein [Deltaproteobacteria bacterium]
MPLLASLLALSLSAPAAEIPVPVLRTDIFTLSNGLQVILSEDHDVPVVHVEVWYHVGSKDEPAGRTGFAHLFEHLMFQGSRQHDRDYILSLQEIGAVVNGSTNTDRTNYYERVPAEELPRALFAEADRMGWLLIDEARLGNQRDVVRNERRQNYENRPYGAVRLALPELLWPEGHPYAHPVIGSHEDLEAATLSDVRDFFRAWYTPNNATLTVVGDFDPAEARTLVERFFGPVPRGPDPPSRAAPPPEGVRPLPAALSGAKEVTLTLPVPVPKVWIAYLTPALYAPGDADLDLLADVLSDGDDSRLHTALVRERKVAREVQAMQSSSQYQSVFLVQATPSEGHTTAEIVAAVDTVLADLSAHPPTEEEIEAARAGAVRHILEGLGTVAGKSRALQSYNHFLGEPEALDRDLERYRTATLASVRKALQTWLPPDRRLVIHVQPQQVTP